MRVFSVLAGVLLCAAVAGADVIEYDCDYSTDSQSWQEEFVWSQRVAFYQTPKGFTPGKGEDTPVWRYYIYTRLYGQKTKVEVAGDVVNSAKACFKVYPSTGGSYWFNPADLMGWTEADGYTGQYFVSAWTFPTDTAALVNFDTPYFNYEYGSPGQGGYGAYTIEIYELTSYTPPP